MSFKYFTVCLEYLKFNLGLLYHLINLKKHRLTNKITLNKCNYIKFLYANTYVYYVEVFSRFEVFTKYSEMFQKSLCSDLFQRKFLGLYLKFNDEISLPGIHYIETHKQA